MLASYSFAPFVALLLLLVVAQLQHGSAQVAIKPTCRHPIYCNLTILQEVADNHLAPDSKSFVDMVLRHSPHTIGRAFDSMFTDGDRPSKEDLKSWMSVSFHRAGSDLLEWSPPDYKEAPVLLQSITDRRMKAWAHELNDLWRTFGRQLDPDVAANPDRHSLINVPHPFIVPGGRFREFYYWDTYWVINGLLVCDMHSTAKGMIENLLQMVDTYGHVLNGGRVYYEERSQPPLLAEMVRHYSKVMQDPSFMARWLPLLEREYEFWMTSRSVLLNSDGSVSHDGRKRSADVMQDLRDGKLYRLNQYRAHSNVARPEGFKEDRQLVADQLGISTYDASKLGTKLYRDIASAAESGWDFSSRWCSKTDGDLTKLRTTDLIPVDLNAILYKNEVTLMNAYSDLIDGETDESKVATYTAKRDAYEVAADLRVQAIQKFLWQDNIGHDSAAGLWLDYDLARQSFVTGGQRFYASSLVPLWAGVHRHEGRHSVDRQDVEQKVLHALTRLHVFRYEGGLPASTVEGTHQQWDFPNGWAPLVLFAVDGFEAMSGGAGREYARDIVSKWLSSTYNAWVAHGKMYEKYDVRTSEGRSGSGGEYSPQSGFGWTNGVTLELLIRFCSRGACVPIDGEIQTDDDGDEFPWFIVGIIGAVVGVTVGGVLCVVVVFVLRKRFRGDGDAVSRRRTGPVELDVDEENSVLPGESVLDEDSEL